MRAAVLRLIERSQMERICATPEGSSRMLELVEQSHAEDYTGQEVDVQTHREEGAGVWEYGLARVVTDEGVEGMEPVVIVGRLLAVMSERTLLEARTRL